MSVIRSKASQPLSRSQLVDLVRRIRRSHRTQKEHAKLVEQFCATVPDPSARWYVCSSGGSAERTVERALGYRPVVPPAAIPKLVWRGEVEATYNGIVLFDPGLLRRKYGGRIRKGTDLAARYFTTDEGDEVLKEGLVVPILSLTDTAYTVAVRYANSKAKLDGEVVCRNDIFPLQVTSRLVVTGLAGLQHWWPEVGWKDVPAQPGFYAVEVRGRVILNADRTELVSCGYEIVLHPRPKLPRLTADMGAAMGVIER